MKQAFKAKGADASEEAVRASLTQLRHHSRPINSDSPHFLTVTQSRTTPYPEYSVVLFLSVSPGPRVFVVSAAEQKSNPKTQRLEGRNTKNQSSARNSYLNSTASSEIDVFLVTSMTTDSA
jgi:hypothetical protein